MRFVSLVLAGSLLALTAATARDAAACGGCFHAPMESTQVASHRMVLSISKTQSTLWDQIQYSGDPTSFAWVLPVKGTVSIGLSSDAMFAQLDSLTRVTVTAPTTCACSNGSSSASASSGGSFDAGVTIIAQQVVGPYETAQLSSQDPAALTNWLTSHGYVIPAADQPTIAAYVSQGFDFLALKLQPGAGIDAMKPVRVTSPGASPLLPLRMVAAGVGAKVPITLFVLGEGRYEPSNYPFFTISQDGLVWDFATNSSNYKDLRQQGFDGTQGRAWLIEAAGPVSAQSITTPLLGAAMFDPKNSGYGDEMGVGAEAEAQADTNTLLEGIEPTALWLTRVYAELPRAALDKDLTLGAASGQTPVSGSLFAKKFVNAPACPCDTSSSSSSVGAGGAGGSGGAGGKGGEGGTGGGNGNGSSSGCAVGGTTETSSALGGLGLALALAAVRRRRARRS
ncbi:hypothetical protein A7982_12947 [Minicystis rosea]|nr:hypothetical protein A7982_12947 [Minicystis rosea]